MLPILQSGIMMYIIYIYILYICILYLAYLSASGWFLICVCGLEFWNPAIKRATTWGYPNGPKPWSKTIGWFWMMPLANLRILECQDMDRICQNFASPFGHELESQFGFERHVSALHVFGAKGGLFPMYDVSTCSSFAYRMLWGLQMFSLKWRSPQNFEKLAWLNCLAITASCILIIQMSHT